MIRVAVIEDEDYFRKEIVLLTPWDDFGCEVVGEASNGFEGLELIQNLLPQIVITDIRMPGLDGLGMIGRVKELVKAEDEPQFIVISGYDDFQYARQALRFGVKNYLLKPVDDEEFHETVKRLATEAASRKERKKLQNSIERIKDSRIMLFRDYLSRDTASTQESYVHGAVDFIREHYREDISIGDAAAHLHICESYLSRLFRKETSYTFLEYLTNYRLKCALELLRDKGVRVYEAAEMVGYKDPRYFGNLFRKYVGLTPLQFKDGLNAK